MMLKDFFNFKRAKSLPEAALFYAVTAVAFVVLVNAAEQFLAGRF